MYQQLEGAGVSTASLNFICRNTDIGESVFFDTIGTPSRVKATLSDFLDHGKIGCESEDGYGWHGRWNLHYMLKIQKLPAGKTPQITDTWVHGFVMLKIFGTEIDHDHLEDWFPSPGAARFGLLLKAGQDVEMEFYLRLRRFVEKTPLAAEWRGWLFRLFTEKRWIHECRTCFGEYRAWIVDFEELELQKAITSAIMQREPELVAIFGEDGMKPIEVEQPVSTNVQQDILTRFIGTAQLRVLRANCRGEEGAFFQEKLEALRTLFTTMPKIYEADGENAVAYLHYFNSSSDWWITERDMEEDQMQAYGLACLHGDWQMAEMGYISIQELIAHGVELDFYWTPKTIAQIKEENE